MRFCIDSMDLGTSMALASHIRSIWRLLAWQKLNTIRKECPVSKSDKSWLLAPFCWIWGRLSSSRSDQIRMANQIFISLFDATPYHLCRSPWTAKQLRRPERGRGSLADPGADGAMILVDRKELRREVFTSTHSSTTPRTVALTEHPETSSTQ